MKMRSGLAGIEEDRVQPHPAGAWRPLGPGAVAAQPRQFLPRLPAVAGAEERGVLDARVDRVGIEQGRLEVPDALELPGMRRAVVPLVRARVALVGERVADRRPGLPAVVGPLHHLAEPAAGLRRVEPVGIGRRALEVVDLPPREVRAADGPPLAPLVRREDEGALPGAHEHSYSAHASLLPESCVTRRAEPSRMLRIVRAGWGRETDHACVCEPTPLSIEDRPPSGNRKLWPECAAAVPPYLFASRICAAN